MLDEFAGLILIQEVLLPTSWALFFSFVRRVPGVASLLIVAILDEVVRSPVVDLRHEIFLDLLRIEHAGCFGDTAEELHHV